MSRPRDTVLITDGVPEEHWDFEALPPSNRRNRPKVPPHIRYQVYERDRFRCTTCGAEDNLTIDHVRSLSKGGKNRKENMQTLCQPCNKAKGDS